MANDHSQPSSLTFAARVAKMMREKRLSQSEVAREIGYTPTAIWNWLQGNTLPRPETLAALASLFGVSEDWLRDGDAPETNLIPDDSFAGMSIFEMTELLRSNIAAHNGYSLNRVRITVELTAN
jgi:transcriptional regulator with XRE-family HTH domain